MAIDPRKRQKKLEWRKAKQKAERRELARRESRGLAARLEDAAAAPVLHCCTTADLWEQGIGNVLLSRLTANGQVAFAAFLVDMYCLGGKDAFWNILPRGQYQRELYDKMAARSGMTAMKPECARKLVEGAVRYASDFGLPPHPDYHAAKLIFGDIAAETCTEEFTYGKDGKPYFIAGPYDGPSRCQQILRTLESHCGPQGHHFIVPATEEDLQAISSAETKQGDLIDFGSLGSH